MEYQDEILCFTGAAVINIAPVPQKEHFYDATGGPFTHSKVNKYLELYTGRNHRRMSLLRHYGAYYTSPDSYRREKDFQGVDAQGLLGVQELRV